MRTPRLIAILPFLLLACGPSSDPAIDLHPPTESCVDRCGKGGGIACGCDDGCGERGDCCVDYEAVCVDEGCGTPEVPACSPGVLVETVDPLTGCGAWICEPCTPLEDPPADFCLDGAAGVRLDDATGCPVEWICVPTCPEAPQPPVCEGGILEPVRDEDGCVSGWSCRPHCAEPDPEFCSEGTLVEGTDPETGCPVWSCLPCETVEAPVCEEGVARPVVDPETSCVSAWECLSLSCEDVCGGMAPGGCSCAPGCERAGTCCEDKVELCGDQGDDRWGDLEGLKDSNLKLALHNRINGHRSLGYTAARKEMFTDIDVIDGQIECIYTGRKTAPTGSNTPGGMNTEHSWPQSQGAKTEPRRSDIHHLFPTDQTANSYRSSYDFGETDCQPKCTWTGGGSKLGPSKYGSGTVFEVRPKYRGDIARAHFYFSVRYQLSIPATEERVLRKWNLEDPPDDVERNRNDAIEAVQNNRNPFVDRPDFVDLISDY